MAATCAVLPIRAIPLNAMQNDDGCATEKMYCYVCSKKNLDGNVESTLCVNASDSNFQEYQLLPDFHKDAEFNKAMYLLGVSKRTTHLSVSLKQ